MIKQLVICSVSFTTLFLSPLCKPADNVETVRKLAIPHQIETTDHIHFYIVEVLTRVLTVTEDEYGPIELVSQNESAVQSRQLRNLKKGLSDVVWMISNTERDSDAHPVRIPIIGGLYGYRVLLMEKQRASSLTLAKVRSMSYTQGPDWPDLAILRANQLQVKASPYRSGFRLVRDGFIDAYPRAAHEAVLELNSTIGRGLTIAPEGLMMYDNPLFFYVADTNIVLANRIKQGLSILIRSGELQRLLESQPFYTSAMKIIRGRTIFELQNPYLSHLAKAAMKQYLEPSEALSYAAEIPVSSSCREDKKRKQC